MKLKLIITIILVIFIISGCGSRSYEGASKVDTPITSDTNNEQVTSTVTIFNIGDTATDGTTDITLNNVRFIDIIDEKDNQFSVAKAPTGKTYAILDITLENSSPDKTTSISHLMSSQVVDNDGYTYDEDFEGAVALEKGYKDGDLLPGMKQRGEIAFLVPKTVSKLKYTYLFEIAGATAVFKIK